MDEAPEPTSQSPPPSLASSQPQYLLLPSDSISVACRRQDIVPVKEMKRPRKPSPSRNRRPSSDEQLDKFLSRGCRCAGNCYQQFSREHYCINRNETSGLSKDEMDMLLIGQIMAFANVDKVVGPSHKHSPHTREATRVNTFFHFGKKICRDTFLALHGIGTHNDYNQLSIVLTYYLFREVTFSGRQESFHVFWS